jgi:hypothetical protein
MPQLNNKTQQNNTVDAYSVHHVLTIDYGSKEYMQTRKFTALGVVL